MIDRATIQIYVEISCANRTERSKNNLAVLLEKFFSLSPSPSENLDDLSRQDLIAMLSKSSIMSMNTFDSFKSKIKNFMVWLCDNGYCSEKSPASWQSIYYSDIDRSEFYDKCYFKNYAELHDTIQSVFANNPAEYDTFISAATLVWFGIEMKNLPNILKDDLHEDAGYMVTPDTKQKIYLPQDALSQLESYKYADTYESSKFGGSIQKYVETQYLFRTYKKGRLTVAQLTNRSDTANRVAAGYGKIFQWNRIYLSGLYARILDTENQFGEIGNTNYDKLKEFFGEHLSKQVLSQKYKEYQAYNIKNIRLIEIIYIHKVSLAVPLFDKISYSGTKLSPFVFSDTLYNNLCLFEKFTDSEVETAISLAGLGDFVAQLPNGLQTELSENGRNLSGGQIQRIALARALLRRSEVILVDEATSSLDTATTSEIMAQLLSLPATVLVITHDSFGEYMHDFDSVLTVRDGEVVG